MSRSREWERSLDEWGCGRVSGRGRNGSDDCRICVRVSESDNGRGGPDRRGSVSGLDRTVVSENESVSDLYCRACHASGSLFWVDCRFGGDVLSSGRGMSVWSLSKQLVACAIIMRLYCVCRGSACAIAMERGL